MRAAGKKVRRISAGTVALSALALFAAAVLAVDLFIFPLRYVWVYAKMPDIPARGDGEMRVHFVDVGQGDCTVLEFPGGESMMIDGGCGSAESNGAVLSACAALGIDRLDYILLTHSDTDHAGGLSAVMDVFGAKTVFLPQFPEENAAFTLFRRRAEETGAQIRISRIYESIISGTQENYSTLLFLWPMYLKEPDGRPSNDTSAVIYLEYAGRRMLLTGDLSAEVEDKLLNDYVGIEGEIFRLEVPAPWGKASVAARLEELDFYKMGHHGSSGSTGEMLVSLCCPREVFISCGIGNGYGHPNLAGISALQAARPDVNFYRTDELGSYTLTVRADGSYTIERWEDV